MKGFIRSYNQEARDLGPLKLWEIKEFVNNFLNRFDYFFGKGLQKKYKIDFSKLVLPTQENDVMRSITDAKKAWDAVEKAGLPHAKGEKDWDTLIAFKKVIETTSIEERILDAGAEQYSLILYWLYLYGYRNLLGNNLVFTRPFNKGAICYEPGDITQTKYTSESFGAITCLSVVEHNVPIQPFFKEMFRLLKKNGHLIVSTDYFRDKIDTTEALEYYYKAHESAFKPTPWTIFSAKELQELIAIGESEGFGLTSSVDLETVVEPIVNYLGKSYSFACLTFQKKQS